MVPKFSGYKYMGQAVTSAVQCTFPYGCDIKLIHKNP